MRIGRDSRLEARIVAGNALGSKNEIIAISPFLFQYPSNGLLSPRIKRLLAILCRVKGSFNRPLGHWGFDIETADAAAAVEHFDHTGIGVCWGWQNYRPASCGDCNQGTERGMNFSVGHACGCSRQVPASSSGTVGGYRADVGAHAEARPNSGSGTIRSR